MKQNVQRHHSSYCTSAAGTHAGYHLSCTLFFTRCRHRLLLGQSGFRFSVGAVDHSLLPNVETGSVVHPVSLFKNTCGVVSSGVNRLEREVELSSLCSSGVSDKCRYTSPRPVHLYSMYSNNSTPYFCCVGCSAAFCSLF